MRIIGIIFLMAIWSCKRSGDENPVRFEAQTETGIDFANILEYTEQVNTYTFKNFYNGGGVGIADINNDSLQDIFFCGNMVSNRLYINMGDFQFEDITVSAGLETEDVWTTGVSFVDLNHDGFLDIYICKSGPPGGEDRANSLYINNGDMTFTEKASEYGLDNIGLSTHATFFDYDRDGDLDCYLLNNSIKSVGGYDLIKDQRMIPDTLGGNKLLRNDSGHFRDVTTSSGIYSSDIGFGLGVTISDLNNDYWPDIYVSNDFFERDYLYINQQDGTFDEALEEYVTEMSMGSMGADIADLNNDGHKEVFVTEMLPERHDRVMSKASFKSWDRYQLELQRGYHHQFGRNALQLNNGDGTFSEISRLVGVEATDWSWGALIFDMDNDGLNDLFVANGIYKDLLDQDYIHFMANPQSIREMLKEDGEAIKKLVDMIPSEALSNYAYRNKGGLQFENVSNEWGLSKPTFSNGSAYGDLDNDGDLDLVLNNVNAPALIYENNTSQLDANHHLTVALKGTNQNPFAIGSLVKVYADQQVLTRELSPMRGFQSSVDYRLHFGLGPIDEVDSLMVVWPDGKVSIAKPDRVDRLIVMIYDPTARRVNEQEQKIQTIFTSEESKAIIDYQHVENDYVDFDRDRLLFEMTSNEGPCACRGDVNGDGLDDLYLGGAKGQIGRLYLQNEDATFRVAQEFGQHSGSEDMDCVFGDFNGDGRADLLIASGGVEFSSFSLALRDRLYLNIDGELTFKEDAALNDLWSTATVSAADFNGDGHLDIFLGERLAPQKYGMPVSGHLLVNDGSGVFQEVSDTAAPELKQMGMITDAEWTDIDADGDPDLVVAGDWMPLKIFINHDGQLKASVESGLSRSHGMYNRIKLADVDQDGGMDIIAGNHGLNSRFRASREAPLSVFVSDFDQNGTLEHITAKYRDGQYYPLIQLMDLVKQLPSLKKQYLKFEAYKHATISEMFTKKQLDQALKYDIYDLETALYLNNGSGVFEKRKLPIEAQFSNVFAIEVADFDKDGHLDILMAGNQHKAKPETGIFAANYGQLFTGDGQGNFSYVKQPRSGLSVQGDVRRILDLKTKDRNMLMLIRNNSKPYLATY